jgi:hypothetical protein
MSRKQIVLLGVLVAVAALLVWLALRNPGPPFLPNDAAHATFSSSDACLECHGPDGSSPRTKNHPLGLDCLRCHR